MKLAIVYHARFTKVNDEYTSISGGFAEYVDSFAPYFDEILLCVPVGSLVSETDTTPLSSSMNIRFYALPSYRRYELELLFKPISLLRGICNAIKLADIVNPKVPGMIGLIAGFFALFYKKPAFLSIGGDWKKSSRYETTSTGIKKIVLNIVISLFSFLLRLLIRRFPTFVTGEDLYEKYKLESPHMFQANDSTFRRKDIIRRRDTCANKELIKLLYVGALSPVKGVNYLLEAFKELRNEGFSVVLTLVGGGTIREDLIRQAEQFDISSLVNFRGYIAQRSALFAIYKSSDIFILPSLSEGVPRVVLEAMAMGVPVIASKVGGIPSLIRDEESGILVSPRSSSEISRAIIKIIQNGELRRKIIKNARQIAEKHSMEKETEVKIQVLKEYNLYPMSERKIHYQ